MINTILFDLDGTLVAAKDWHFEALNGALAYFGFEPIPYEVHLEKYDGLPTRLKLQTFGITDQDMMSKISQMKQVKTQAIIKEKCREDPRLRREIAMLWHRGYRMAICSNAIDITCKLMLWGIGAQDYFWFVISNEAIQEPKPSPLCWQTAMDMFGVTPNQTLILEDSAVGLASAYASGAYVYPVKSPEDVVCDNIVAAIEEIDSAPDHHATGRGGKPFQGRGC